MSMSSLQQQLNQFKQNQKADPKLPDNSSATFLFDFRTANKIDRETIFTLGYEGLKELARLDKKFFKYFEKLFNNTSKYFQRETKLKSELSEIDFYLENLIVDLIDYFHLKPTHKVMEYLIKIFNINAYNPKILALAFLPFHESKYYIKLLQNLNLELNQNLKFLTHFSKTGTVVLEELLFKEIFNNFDLIKEIFNFYEEKIIQNSQKALELKKNSDSAYQNSYNSVIESEKYFKFLSKLIKYFFGNLGNNKRIDKTNFFILVLNFIRINIKHFSLVNEYANTKLANVNGFNVYFSSDSFDRNVENNDFGEVNYIIKEICELVILMNSKYKINNEYANALLNDILNNFLFFKNTKNLNSTRGDIINSNNKNSAEFVITSILLFVNEFENRENNMKSFALRMDRETLETLFDNISSFDLATKVKNKKSNHNKDKENKTLFATILEKLSNEFNFYPFLKLIINSVFAQIESVFAEADKQINSGFSNIIENSEVFAALSNKIFQALNFIKIQKSEVFTLCEHLMSLDDMNNNESLFDILQSKISFLNSFKNKNNKEDISFAVTKLVERTFIHLENLYIDDFNSFLIKFFEATKKTEDKSRITKYLKSIENYKLLSSSEDNLFDLFVNLNSTNINSLANSIEKIDELITENKGEVVKFTFNSLMRKFHNLEQEFLLKKILNMKNFSYILTQTSANNAKNEKYRTEILEFYFRIYEEKIGLYSNEFLEKLNLFVLANFISDPNEDNFNKFFVYFYTFDFKLPDEKLSNEIKSNKFLTNLISETFSNDKKMDEYVITLSCSNSIKSICHINSLIKVLFEKKSAEKKTIVNLISLVSKIHLKESLKFKNNCSSSTYLKLIGKIIEILNFLNFEIFSFKKAAVNNKKLTSNNSAVGLMEDMFYDISDNLISNILFHKDFLACISQIAFLILNSQEQRIRALFDKIINFVFEAEIFHFITYLILTDKSALFESYEDIDKKDVNDMNTVFNKNILSIISSKIIKFEDAKNTSNSKLSLDFGLVLALIYLLNECEDNSVRENVLDILDSLNSQKDKIEISFLHYNSLFGLEEIISPKKVPTLTNSKDIDKSNTVVMDLVNLISGNKNEILVNKNNLQKIFNNSKNVNFNLFLVAFDYFIANSDEFTDFTIFNKATNFIVKKMENKNLKKHSSDNKKDFKNDLNYNLECFNEQQVEFIFESLFSESLKLNPNYLKLQDEVVSIILDFFDSEENCLAFIISKLLQDSKLDQEEKYSRKLIRKVAQSNLLEKIDFTKSSISRFSETTNIRNSSNKQTIKESEDLSIEDNHYAFDLIKFINLIIKHDIASSEIANVTKINYNDILTELLESLKSELSQKNKNSKINKSVNIRDTIFFIFEMILKNQNFTFTYSLKTLEFLESLCFYSEIDSNFLIMSNNLFSLLTHANPDSDENVNRDSDIKSICEKIEAVILRVCENLANKRKTINEEFYIVNTNRTFASQVYQEVEKMEKENSEENKMQEDDLIEGEEVVANAISFSYEYLNILNTLFLSLNKAIIFQSKKEFERDIVLRVINKAFEIFYANNQKIITSESSQDFEMENEIGYKFKKDIFSVILNSIINFVTSLLSNRNPTENEDLDVFYEYIQTLVKLTIKNFNDDIYLDNILKKFLELIKPFDNRLVSCLFVTVYYYSIENNFERFLEKKESTGSSSLIEQFSKFFEFEKEQNSYYNRIINSYFEDILELNYQKFDENSVAKVLLILEEIFNSISNDENENNKNNVYFILSIESSRKNKICFFENLRNLVINLCIKILSQIKHLFYLNESQKLKENLHVYSIVLSINNKILKCYKLSNKILNKIKDNKGNENSNNREVKALLTNVFNKNLKTFEDNFFEIIIESNILHYLIINIFDKIENEKEQILLRNFLLQKYFNLIKSDCESIQDTNIVSKNSAKSKKKAKSLEHYEVKFNDNLVVFKKLLLNFDKEHSKNYENVNLIFSVLTEIIVFTQKFAKLNQSGKNNIEIFNVIKESKRLDSIISSMTFDNNACTDEDNTLPLSFYSSKFSIFNFMVKFFTVYELKFFDCFNKFIQNIQNYLDVLYHKFFLNSKNNENKEILVSVLKSIYELVNSRSEYMSPVIEQVIFQISLLFEENFTAEIINRIFETLGKKQLFDVSFKAVKFAFKNYDKLIAEKDKIANSIIQDEKKKIDINFITYKGISKKLNTVLNYLNTAIKYSDKLVITDINLSIIKFIYRILMNKNYNNKNSKNNSIKSFFIKHKGEENGKTNENSELENKLTDLSDSILICLKSLILKMNEKQFKGLFEEFLFAFFKEEIDSKNPDDLDTEKVGNKYKLNNCIVSLQVFNEIFESLNSIFVGYFEKYKNVLIQILNHINSVFCTANKDSNKKKKERNHFEEKFDDENNKFSYLNLSNLAMRNVSLAFKYDKSILMQETIQEFFEPISYQLKFIYFTETKYQEYFDSSVKMNICEIYKNIKNEDLFREMNEMILNLIREDHYQIRLFVIKLFNHLFFDLKDKLILHIHDIIPFITESLEDQNERVQIEAFNLIKLIEKQTGEDIKNYIEN